MGTLKRIVMSALIVVCIQIRAEAGQTMSPQAGIQSVVIDGFLTRVPTGNHLESGNVVIQVGHGTKCLRFIPTYGETYSFLIVGTDLKMASCDQLNLHVGSRIHVSGTRESDGTVDASLIEAGNSLVVAKGTLPRTSIGNNIDWRLDDRYSGGPSVSGSSGGAFSEEMPSRLSASQPNKFLWWVNGFPLEITASTHVRTPSNSGRATPPIFRPQNTGGSVWVDRRLMSEVATAAIFQAPTAYVSYRISQDPHGHISASAIDLLSYRGSPEAQAPRTGDDLVVVAPNYEMHQPGSIQFKGKPPIVVIPDRAIQNYVADAAQKLIAQIDKGSEDSLSLVHTSIHCWVVKAFANVPGDFYVQNDALANESKHRNLTESDKGWALHHHRSMVNQIVVMPDGTILVPDSELALFDNAAQMQFALSAVIASITQMIPLANKRYESQSPDKSASDGYFQTQRVIRLGIRQMYVAGYDIREAPFAWAIAAGKPAVNPLIDAKDPDRQIPWYAAYGFDYISKYYQDVDFSKLKRGEAEYQQFLKELRVADPEAFAGK